MSLHLPSPTHTGSVDGREVIVYDSLIDAPTLAAHYAMLQGGQFRRTEFARQETFDTKHWVMNLELSEVESWPLLHWSSEAANQHFGPGHRAHRAYCNVALYGDQLMTHTDCNSTNRIITALWYICPEWNIEWGGETLFFNSAADAVVAVTPKPGRLVVFDGTILHVGRPPNRICSRSRYTLAFKFRREAR